MDNRTLALGKEVILFLFRVTVISASKVAIVLDVCAVFQVLCRNIVHVKLLVTFLPFDLESLSFAVLRYFLKIAALTVGHGPRI